jgi:hypothetical protein
MQLVTEVTFFPVVSTFNSAFSFFDLTPKLVTMVTISIAPLALIAGDPC